MVSVAVQKQVVGPDGKPISYKGKLTVYVFFVAVIASCGGLLFGYDIGITGGVSSMPAFLEIFFPVIAQQQKTFKTSDPYCTYNSALLQFFTSIAFIGGLLSAPVASICTKNRGRKLTLTMAGLMYLIGAVLLCSAHQLPQIYIGRLVLGFGVGFANQVTPMYLAEVAPASLRGALTIAFQQCTTIGIFVAQLINYGTQKKDYGWRISLGLMGFPALLLLFGGLIVPESPNSLVERGMDEKGLKVLRKLRGVQDVEYEFNDIKNAAEQSKAVKNSWAVLFSRKQAPQAITCMLMPFFQQFTGINIIMFYAPQIFGSIGASVDMALLQTVITGAINVASTFAAIILVDRLGRKVLLLEGGTYNKMATIPKETASALLAMACIFIAGFAWSWGPIAWLVPAEILTLETRSAGQGVNTSINFLATFIVGQSFLSMFCSMRYGVFIFFAAWVVVMTIFVHLFVVESRNVPLEEVHEKYHAHWFWKKIVGPLPTTGGKVVDEKQTADQDLSKV